MRRSVVIMISHVPAWHSASSTSGGGIRRLVLGLFPVLLGERGELPAVNRLHRARTRRPGRSGGSARGSSAPSHTAAACATASPPACERETSMSADSPRSRRTAAALPCSSTRGRPAPVAQDLDVGPAQSLRRPRFRSPSSTASFAAKRAARCSSGLARRAQYASSRAVKTSSSIPAFSRRSRETRPPPGCRCRPGCGGLGRHHRLDARPCPPGSRP